MDIKLFGQSNTHCNKYREYYVKSLIPEFYGDELKNYYYEDMSMLIEERITDLKGKFLLTISIRVLFENFNKLQDIYALS